MGTIATTVTITVDLQHPEINTIHAKQFDSLSRYADIKLLSGGQPWAAESSITYVMQYEKPDGTKGMYDKLPDGTTDAVTAETDASGCTVLRTRFAPQMMTVAGRVRFSVAMVQTDGTKLQTFSAILDVEPSEVNSYTSEDYYKVTSLDELLEEIKKRVKSVNNIIPNANGDVYINAESINAQVPSLDYHGSVEGALEALATMQSALPVARASSADGIAYTATGDDLPTVSVADNMSQISAVGKGRQIVFIPHVKNASNAPTLRLNGGEIIPLRLRAPQTQNNDDQSPEATLPVPVGALMRGVPYTLTFCGKYWLVDSHIALMDDERAEMADRMAGIAMSMAAKRSIGFPIVNGEVLKDEENIVDRTAKAYISRAAAEAEKPIADGVVEIPTVNRVSELIASAIGDTAAAFANMDGVIGGAGA